MKTRNRSDSPFEYGWLDKHRVHYIIEEHSVNINWVKSFQTDSYTSFMKLVGTMIIVSNAFFERNFSLMGNFRLDTFVRWYGKIKTCVTQFGVFVTKTCNFLNFCAWKHLYIWNFWTLNKISRSSRGLKTKCVGLPRKKWLNFFYYFKHKFNFNFQLQTFDRKVYFHFKRFGYYFFFENNNFFKDSAVNIFPNKLFL